MYNPDEALNEQRAATAFTKQAPVFDALYASNLIIKYKRERVRNHLQHYLSPGSHILELNSGTGDDAVFLSAEGHYVHATDISVEMQKVLKKKREINDPGNRISTEICSFTNLENLQLKGPYDAIFSNFAGLNCTGKLNEVLLSFKHLLKPGGIVTLVIMPKFCLWETSLFLKGHFTTAVRRFFSKNGRQAHIEGEYFKCWYYNPSYVTRNLKKDFKVLSIEGLCTIVPPSYLENFPVKYPRVFSFLKAKENKYKGKWPWKYIGDYYIISLKNISSQESA